MVEAGEEPVKIDGALDEFSGVWSYGDKDEIVLKGAELDSIFTGLKWHREIFPLVPCNI